MLPGLLFLAGAFGWSASEYAMHRFAGHGRFPAPRGRFWWATPKLLFLVFHHEHVAHHRNPMYFAATWKKLVVATLLVPVFGGVVSLGAGTAGGLAFGLGYAATYFVYEVLHRRIHTHAPTNGYFAWMRRHHLHHHVAPGVNHGVTSPLWDLVAGTVARPLPVRIPRSLAPTWLLDPTGAPRAEFATEYELTGR